MACIPASFFAGLNSKFSPPSLFFCRVPYGPEAHFFPSRPTSPAHSLFLLLSLVQRGFIPSRRWTFLFFALLFLILGSSGFFSLCFLGTHRPFICPGCRPEDPLFSCISRLFSFFPTLGSPSVYIPTVRRCSFSVFAATLYPTAAPVYSFLPLVVCRFRLCSLFWLILNSFSLGFTPFRPLNFVF